MQPIGATIKTTENKKFLIGLSREEFEELRQKIEDEDQAIFEETMKEAKKRKILRLFDEKSLINKDLQKATFDNYIPNNKDSQLAINVSKRYVDTFNLEEPRNLVFYGSYGTGKSHLSVSITKEIMEKEFTSVFISMPKLLTKIKHTYNKDSGQTEAELMEYLESVDLLVLDDIGAERDNEWAISKLFEIVDGRIGKHTIYTTNYTPEDLRNRIGDRNYSRVMQNTYEVKMIGDDFRLRRG